MLVLLVLLILSLALLTVVIMTVVAVTVTVVIVVTTVVVVVVIGCVWVVHAVKYTSSRDLGQLLLLPLSILDRQRVSGPRVLGLWVRLIMMKRWVRV